MAEKQIGIQSLELIDGYGREPAVMVEPSPLEVQCAPGRHCCAHGGGPFFCCRCGAAFSQPLGNAHPDDWERA